MKKIILSIAAVFAFGIASAQDSEGIRFGVKAGVDIASVKADMGPVEVSESYTGFFAGAFMEIGVTEKFAVQPEVLYVSLPDDFSFLSIPVMAKFNVAEDFALMVGPDLNYFLNAEEDEFKVNIGAGGSYNVTDNLDINAKYSIGFGDVKVSGLFVGLGYMF